jgi:hypothetical protein
MLLLALLSAIAVGVGFGFYPAWRPARIDPIDACGRRETCCSAHINGNDEWSSRG